MSDFDPRYYYVRRGGEWVPKAEAKADGGERDR
jgi:hypothetical protein